MAGYQNNYLSLAKLSSSRKLIFLYYVQGQLLCPSDLINAIMTVQTHTGNTHILFINKFMQTHSHQVHPKTFGKRIFLLINKKCNKIRRDSPSVSNCLQQISLEHRAVQSSCLCQLIHTRDCTAAPRHTNTQPVKKYSNISCIH